MNQVLLSFLFGIAVGILALVFFRKYLRKNMGAGGAGELRQKQAEAKEKHKQIILQGIDMQKSINNDTVQNLLGVSDATATRYLDELEKEGAIKQIGDRGRGVFYERA